MNSESRSHAEKHDIEVMQLYEASSRKTPSFWKSCNLPNVWLIFRLNQAHSMHFMIFYTRLMISSSNVCKKNVRNVIGRATRKVHRTDRRLTNCSQSLNPPLRFTGTVRRRPAAPSRPRSVWADRLAPAPAGSEIDLFEVLGGDIEVANQRWSLSDAECDRDGKRRNAMT